MFNDPYSGSRPMVKRKVITIDGLAGSGKTSISRALAERTGFAHFNSGLLYRSVGFLALSNGVGVEDEAALDILLRQNSIELLYVDGVPQLRINGVVINRGGELQAPEISEAASRAAALPAVRAHLIKLQREAFPGVNIVAEGRDMGTVVFPEADLKFFIEASVDIRMNRRVDQLLQGASDGKSEREKLEKQIEIEILERDARDRGRAISPTIPAPDAILVDNSAVSLTQLVSHLYDTAHSRGVI